MSAESSPEAWNRAVQLPFSCPKVTKQRESLRSERLVRHEGHDYGRNVTFSEKISTRRARFVLRTAEILSQRGKFPK